MKRGEIWTVSGGGAYAGKPRPAIILQDDRFDATSSVTICAFTTDPTEAPFLRLRVEPNGENGLREPSSVMVDRLTTVPRNRIGERIGRLDDGTIALLNRAILVFLGLAGTTRRRRGNVGRG